MSAWLARQALHLYPLAATTTLRGMARRSELANA